MGTDLRRILLVAAVVFFLGCDLEDIAGSARYKKDFHYSYKLSPGGRLSVENFNGPVKIIAGDGSEVTIDGTRYASSPELLAALKVDVVADDDFIQVRTVRPSGHRGNMGARYTIHTPRKVELDRIINSNGSLTIEGTRGTARLRTSNGRITITGVTGNVEAGTSNGSVHLADCRGSAVLRTSNGSIRASGVRDRFEATTSNGSIKAGITGGSSDEPIEVRTSNGSITLTLREQPATDIIATTSNASITVRAPESLAARVKLSTSNGSVKTDFQVLVSGTQKKTRLNGTINGGGPLVKLTSSNGNIRLLKLSSVSGAGGGL